MSDSAAGPASGHSRREPLLVDTLLELAELARRWASLTLEDALLVLRSQLVRAAAVVGFLFFGSLLILGGIVLFDLLLYGWLALALESRAWALFALSLGHVALGGLLLRYGLNRLQGEDDS